jgi:hypothetical protein
VTFSLNVEQSLDGVEWWTLAGMSTEDLQANLQAVKKSTGLPWRDHLTLNIIEQVYRDDVVQGKGWRTAHTMVNEDTAVYHQLALEGRYRITVTTSSAVGYSVESNILRKPAPPAPIGQRSASLLGTFAAAEGAGALTTGSRTTTNGSLITGTAGSWHGEASVDINPCTDNKSNTYTEPTNGEVYFSSSGVSHAKLALSYNIGGTRGSSHTISHVDEGDSNSLGAQEWDGVAASPTVVADDKTGNSQLPDGSVSVSGSSLVILIFGYDGSSTTMGVDDGTQAQEIDENNDNQSCAVHYKVAQAGTPSITGNLTASRTWGSVIVAFTESGGAAPTSFLFRRNPMRHFMGR